VDRERFAARRREILSEESKQPLCWWYLSFADDEFLGACVVEGRGILSAVEQAHALGINPGGQVLAVKVHRDDEGRLPTNRLLSREEVARHGGGVVTVGELEDNASPRADEDGSRTHGDSSLVTSSTRALEARVFDQSGGQGPSVARAR
jgi:hypothetical protein